MRQHVCQVRQVCGVAYTACRLAVCRWRLGSASGAYQYPSAGSGELRVGGESSPNYFSGDGVRMPTCTCGRRRRTLAAGVKRFLNARALSGRFQIGNGIGGLR